MSLHEDCIGCSKNGSIFNDLSPHKKNGSVSTELYMDKRMEGWGGISHGGFGMGALIELVSALNNYPQAPDDLYPFCVSFKVGGAKAAIGDTVNLLAEEQENGATAQISVNGNPQPYISMSMSYRKDDPELCNEYISYMPQNIEHIKSKSFILPRYENCFVCGTHREGRGLKRQFEITEYKTISIIIAKAGFVLVFLFYYNISKQKYFKV